MKISHTFIIILIIIFATSCNEPKEDVFIISENEFHVVIETSEERKHSSEIINIRNFFVRDSFLIITNSREDNIFMVFDLLTFSCIQTWGVKGNGPEEYGLFTHAIDISPYEFIIADFSKYSVETYSIKNHYLSTKTSILDNNQTNENREIPQKIISPDGINFYYNQIHREPSIKKWTKGDDPYVINSFKHRNSSNSPHNLYSGYLALSNSRERIVYAYRYQRRFDILDFEGHIIKSCEVHPANNPIIRSNHLDMERSAICFLNARSFEDSFYLLYIGHSPKTIEKEDFSVTCFIEEYDWDGNPLRRFKLNRYIHDFDVFALEKDILSFIGVDITNENPLVLISPNIDISYR